MNWSTLREQGPRAGLFSRRAATKRDASRSRRPEAKAGFFFICGHCLTAVVQIQPDPRLLKLLSICGSRFDGPLRSTYWWACSRYFRAVARSPVFT